MGLSIMPPSTPLTLQKHAEEVLSKLSNIGGFPQTPSGSPLFSEPWQASIFGMVVTLHESNLFPRGDFQELLIQRIEKTDPSHLQSETDWVYYSLWIEILEQILSNQNHMEISELDKRTLEFAEGIRDASEFIIGGHSHSHEGHSHPH